MRYNDVGTKHTVPSQIGMDGSVQSNVTEEVRQ
jgi:hypothetical protein